MLNYWCNFCNSSVIRYKCEINYYFYYKHLR